MGTKGVLSAAFVREPYRMAADMKGKEIRIVVSELEGAPKVSEKEAAEIFIEFFQEFLDRETLNAGERVLWMDELIVELKRERKKGRRY